MTGGLLVVGAEQEDPDDHRGDGDRDDGASDEEGGDRFRGATHERPADKV